MSQGTQTASRRQTDGTRKHIPSWGLQEERRPANTLILGSKDSKHVKLLTSSTIRNKYVLF